MATIEIVKKEFRVLLNNGISESGNVKTNNVKIADLDESSNIDATEAAALINVSNAIEPILSKSIYETDVAVTSALYN